VLLFVREQRRQGAITERMEREIPAAWLPVMGWPFEEAIANFREATSLYLRRSPLV